jgi:hypothetical protein
MPALIARLFPGPVDVVGDIHGEMDALQALVTALGYDTHGSHPQGRHLVFIGDLIDRGPDSPAVVEWVQSLLESGAAQCVLGNHELNVLRNDLKSGNAWLIAPDHPEQQPGGEFQHCRPATPAMRERYLAFFDTLPLALVRTDLRVVHAAWHDESVRLLTHEQGTVPTVYERHAAPARRRLMEEGLTARAHAEEAQWQEALEDRHARVPLLRAAGEHAAHLQMSNPVRVLTSGLERVEARPRWSAGRWRMCQRVRWWEEYTDEPSVIIGHYWRRLRPGLHTPAEGEPRNLFGGLAPQAWLGPRHNVFCVDYSVGGRYRERHGGLPGTHTHLCALRWPERQLWGESGPVPPDVH